MSMSEDNKNENVLGTVQMHYVLEGVELDDPPEHFYGGAVVCRSGDAHVPDKLFGSLEEVKDALSKLGKNCPAQGHDKANEDVVSFTAVINDNKRFTGRAMDLDVTCDAIYKEETEGVLIAITDPHFSRDVADVAKSMAGMSQVFAQTSCSGYKQYLPTASRGDELDVPSRG